MLAPWTNSKNKPRQEHQKAEALLCWQRSVGIVKATVFPAVMYGCESWTIKKTEHRRTDAFKWWCWRRLLRVPWIARRADQLILKEVNPEYSLEGLMLKLKLPYFGHLMQRADSLEKTLMLGQDWGKEEKGVTENEMVKCNIDSMDMSLNKLLGIVKAGKPGVLQSTGSWRVRHDLVTEQQQEH